MADVLADLSAGTANLRFPITQVSLAVRDLDRTMAHYHQAFGWAPWQVFNHVPPVHHNTELRGQSVHYALRGAEVYVGSLNFELLQPLEGPNLWTELIERSGEGIASIATMFHERADGDAVKAAFLERFGIPITMKAEIGDHIEYFYLDTEARFGCLIESGSGHAIDFVRPVSIFPSADARPEPSPMSGIEYPITQVTLVTNDLGARMRAFHGALGWGPWKLFPSDLLACVFTRGDRRPIAACVAQARVGDLNVEIVEPRSPIGPWHDYLMRGGDGLAGISVTVRSRDELDATRAMFASLGIEVLADGEVGGEPWLVLDSEREFKTVISVGLGHAHDRVAPASTYP